jgi:hypothetical protein
MTFSRRVELRSAHVVVPQASILRADFILFVPPGQAGYLGAIAGRLGPKYRVPAPAGSECVSSESWPRTVLTFDTKA